MRRARAWHIWSINVFTDIHPLYTHSVWSAVRCSVGCIFSMVRWMTSRGSLNARLHPSCGRGRRVIETGKLAGPGQCRAREVDPSRDLTVMVMRYQSVSFGTGGECGQRAIRPSKSTSSEGCVAFGHPPPQMGRGGRRTGSSGGWGGSLLLASNQEHRQQVACVLGKAIDSARHLSSIHPNDPQTVPLWLRREFTYTINNLLLFNSHHLTMLPNVLAHPTMPIASETPPDHTHPGGRIPCHPIA
jgi:hypothetical protein